MNICSFSSEVAAEVNLVFEISPNSFTLDVQSTLTGTMNTGAVLFKDYMTEFLERDCSNGNNLP